MTFVVFLTFSAPSWLPDGVYKLAVACWLLIVVGWFACALAAIKSLAMSILNRVEDRVEQTADDIINPQQVDICSCRQNFQDICGKTNAILTCGISFSDYVSL
jgi:hypothetical protein